MFLSDCKPGNNSSHLLTLETGKVAKLTRKGTLSPWYVHSVLQDSAC
jgi:hypothetical protein